MPADMPMPVGGISPYSSDHVFAKTPEKSYTLADLGQFLEDAATLSGRASAAKLWPGIQEIYAKIKAPVVSTHVIYGNQVETIASVTYASANVTEPCVDSTKEMGDGTITASALEAVSAAWIAQGADIKMFKCPMKVNHKNLIVAGSTIEYMRNLLGVGEEEGSE